MVTDRYSFLLLTFYFLLFTSCFFNLSLKSLPRLSLSLSENLPHQHLGGGNAEVVVFEQAVEFGGVEAGGDHVDDLGAAAGKKFNSEGLEHAGGVFEVHAGLDAILVVMGFGF